MPPARTSPSELAAAFDRHRRDPDAALARRQTTELVFVAAVAVLPPRQRGRRPPRPWRSTC